MSVEPVPIPWLLALVNAYAARPRIAAGEEHLPYPALPEPVGSAGLDVQELVGLADQLWPVFGGPTDAERADRLNALLDRSALSPRVDPAGGTGWTSGATGPAAVAMAGCAVALLAAVREHGWTLLGACAGDDCVDVYLATSARGGRRYCSSTCLNRARVRAYRSRHRPET